MRKFILVFLLLALLPILGCNVGDSHDAVIPFDPCAGPVPCLYDWWEYWEVFIDAKGDLIWVYSNGESFLVEVWIEFEGIWQQITFEGDAVTCYDGNVLWIVYPPYMILDPPCEENRCEAEGRLRICYKSLTLTELYEYRTDSYWDDITAIYR